MGRKWQVQVNQHPLFREIMTYDPLMRLHRLTAKDPGGTALLDYTYDYDAVGNITAKTTEHGNYTFGYDTSSRLTSADNPALPDETYTYDHVGNRQTASGVSGTWSYNINNELLGYADVEYTYDANGNLTQKRVGAAAVNYSYNAENRLIKVEDDLTKVVMAEYGYDPFGRRLWKEVQGVRTYFFYSEEGLIAEYDATGNELRSYGYQPDSTWGTDPLWLKQGGHYYFYQNDHLGTPQRLVAMNGAVVWSATYEAFGKAQVDIETVVNNLRFPGQYYDAETGLCYNWFRYYEPGSGRYVQKDPIGLAGQQLNFYAYGWSNPINVGDPSGLQVQVPNPGPIVPRPVPTLPPIAPVPDAPLKTPPETLPTISPWIAIPIYILLDLLRNQQPVGLSPDQEAEAIIDAIENPESQPERDEKNCYRDDFGRRCRGEFMEEVTIYSTSIYGQWHASLQVRGHASGWWPVTNSAIDGLKDFLIVMPGERRNDEGIISYAGEGFNGRYKIKYNACNPPDDAINNSVVAIEMSIYMGHSTGEFNYVNAGARNCAGWVCQVLSWAGWAPMAPKQKLYTPGPGDVTCVTPGLEPLHLVPQGLTHSLLHGNSFEQFQSIIYGRYYKDLFVDWIF